jgi:hypothetical protein
MKIIYSATNIPYLTYCYYIYLIFKDVWYAHFLVQCAQFSVQVKALLVLEWTPSIPT